MITNISYIQPTNFQYSSPVKHNKISFGHNIPTLTHTNIGSCAEGYIGKIRVRKDNGEAFLNVFKKFLGENVENYTIKNDKSLLNIHKNHWKMNVHLCTCFENNLHLLSHHF